MAVLIAVAAALLAAIAFAALRRPVLARLALRGATRRRGETTLVILGSLLGTAIITGSLLVGDTLDASVRASAPNQLGPTDLVVRSATPQAGEAAAAALDGLSDPSIDGVLALRTLQAAVATTDEGDRRAQPAAQLLEVDFAAAAAFGGDPAATGISGATPKAGETAVGADLAAELGVEVGDAVEAFAYGTSEELTVTAILPRTGVAGYWTGFEATSMNAFVAPGTIQSLRESAGPGAETAQPPQDLVLVSAAGDVFTGADATAPATAAVEAALAGVEGVQVSPVKSDVLAAADAAGASFSELFLSIGSFAVLAGILLLVNIFVMLAEERKSELGMLRAVGLKRRDLVRMFAIEGAAYAVVSALLGALLGILVGRVIVLVATGIFASFGDLTLTFTVPVDSIATGFLVGLIISLLTILVTSLRISRINIIRAIRDLPEPAARAQRRLVPVLQAVGAVAFGAASVASIAGDDPYGGLAFPALTALCLAGVLGRVLPRRPVLSLLAGLTLAYAVFADQIVGFEGGDIQVFVVQGVVLTASAVALVGQNQEAVGRLLRLLGGGRSLVVRLGVAYPLARRFRTSMTLAMYSLVVFTLVFISVLSQVFASLTDEVTADEGGGYDVLANAAPANPVDPDDLAGVGGVAEVAVLDVGQAEFRPPSREEFASWGIAGVDADFVGRGAPGLQEWDTDAYPTEADVWAAVAADPGLAVVDSFFLQDGGGPPEQIVAPGDVLEVRDPASGAVTERTVAAVSDAGLTFSIWMSKDSVADAVALTVPARYYIDVADGADAEAVAARIQGGFVANGVQADTFRSLVEENSQANTQFFRLMQGYLALGLVVGIAGLGVIMVRAVRERRREVGMLRSLGVQAGKVRSAFLLESGFVALEGIVIGTALALVTSYQIITQSDALGDISAPFTVPWGQLALLLGIAIVASLAATAAPAQQASRIKPAVALRIAD